MSSLSSLIKAEIISKFPNKDNHFYKSLNIYNFKFRGYESVFRNNELKKSTNCYYTIAKINQDGKEVQIFIKIEDIQEFDTQSKKKDFILFDILNNHIFEILKSDTNIDHSRIPVFLKSFLSYYKIVNDKYYWNYNDIINYKSDTSPYNSTIQTPYTKPCYVYISEAVYGYTIYQFFKMFFDLKEDAKKKEKEEIIFNIINDFSYLYDFIEYIGIEYGFLHNDLHFNNILIDLNKKKLVLIDFGRSSFGHFYNNNNDNLNEFISYNIENLNLHPYFSDNITYEGVFKNQYLNLYNLIAKNHVNNKYPHVITDLITISANMYLYLKCFYLFTNNTDKYQDLINLFEPLINLETTNVEELINRNFEFSTQLNVHVLFNIYMMNIQTITKNQLSETDPNIKRTYLKINEGLFFMSLLMNYKKKERINFKINMTTITSDSIFYYNFQVMMLNKDLDNFIRYLTRIYQIPNNNIYKVLNNTYSFTPQPVQSSSLITTGGKKKILKTYKNQNHNNKKLKHILTTYNYIYG